jgi:hypothetical protein
MRQGFGAFHHGEHAPGGSYRKRCRVPFSLRQPHRLEQAVDYFVSLRVQRNIVSLRAMLRVRLLDDVLFRGVDV